MPDTLSRRPALRRGPTLGRGRTLRRCSLRRLAARDERALADRQHGSFGSHRDAWKHLSTDRRCERACPRGALRMAGLVPSDTERQVSWPSELESMTYQARGVPRSGNASGPRPIVAVRRSSQRSGRPFGAMPTQGPPVRTHAPRGVGGRVGQGDLSPGLRRIKDSDRAIGPTNWTL